MKAEKPYKAFVKDIGNVAGPNEKRDKSLQFAFVRSKNKGVENYRSSGHVLATTQKAGEARKRCISRFSRLVVKWVFVKMSLDFKISRFNGRLMISSKIRRLRIHLGDLIVAGKGKYLQFVICNIVSCNLSYICRLAGGQKVVDTAPQE
ncbi:hypothetical protein L2E82_01190 [Cichorium intybus]|uniref:Uncharacterized protein n=1 Tax=Cichorium intybus TaxID=13427 RepID=A0ACB9GXX0_CICIN|nr:hypothetical protein L2E82_01190 [Cichorium intybus]